MTDGQYVERSAGGPDAYRSMFESTFGPVIAIRAALATERQRLSAFDPELREFTTRGHRSAPGGPAEYPFEYLLVVAHTRPR
jgi:hypothetical protein